MGWGEQKLSLLCDMFTDGDWVESKDQSPEGVRLIQTGNVGEGVFKDRRDKSRFISEETFSRLKCTEILEGDCLVSRLPDPVGRSCLIPYTGEKMITAVDCTIIRLNRSHLLPEFFNYFTQSYAYLNVVESLTSGATRKRISRKNLGEVPIPLPPIPEQQRIVAILNQAFADIEKARANAEKNLKNARELFDSYLNQVFSQRGEGWVENKLGDVCSFENGDRGKNYPSRAKFVESGIAFINAGHIDDGRVDFSKMNYISQETFALLSRGKIQVDDVLFCLRGSLGKFAVIESEQQGAIASSLVIVRPRSDLSVPFLLHYLRSGLCKNMILKYAAGAAQPNLGAKDLAKFTISVPNESIQADVSGQLDVLMGEIDKLEKLYQAKLVSLDELKKSLLQKAFSGELTKTEGQAA